MSIWRVKNKLQDKIAREIEIKDKLKNMIARKLNLKEQFNQYKLIEEEKIMQRDEHTDTSDYFSTTSDEDGNVIIKEGTTRRIKKKKTKTLD